MRKLDPDALQTQAPLLSDDVLRELHAEGMAAYPEDVWAILDGEMRRRASETEAGTASIIENSMIPSPMGPVVTVFSGTPDEVIMARLVLDGEQIPYVSSGEGLQDLFGLGRLFGGVNFITGPVRIAVSENHAALAREALRSLGG